MGAPGVAAHSASSALVVNGLTVFRLVVYGAPQPAGSKKAFILGKGPNRRAIITDDAKRSRPWKNNVAQQAGEAMADHGLDALLAGPLHVTFQFYRRRPKSHFGARGNVKPKAPPYPTTKPDLLKLARAVEDALAGVVYQDDAQIISEELRKLYGEPERVVVEISKLEET